jgi:hypothetical protein
MDLVHGDKEPVHGSGWPLLTSFPAALRCPSCPLWKEATIGALYAGMRQRPSYLYGRRHDRRVSRGAHHHGSELRERSLPDPRDGFLPL